MKITKEDVKYIAELSYLKLSPDEVERFQRDLSSVLTYIDTLNKADTSNVLPPDKGHAPIRVMRDDKVVSDLTTDQMLKNTPRSEDGFILVPKVI